MFLLSPRSLAPALFLTTIALPMFGQSVAQKSGVYRLPAGVPVQEASATLLRNQTGITSTVHTSGLEPGAAITFWWLVFNNPAKCSNNDCGEDDLLPVPNIEAGASILNGGGHIIGGTGASDFGAHLNVNDTSGGALFGPGLLDPFKAQIGIVLRTHGQPIAGLVDAQIDSYTGGCEVNSCQDSQIATFLPAEDTISQRFGSIEEDIESLDKNIKKLELLLRTLGLQLGLGRVPGDPFAQP